MCASELSTGHPCPHFKTDAWLMKRVLNGISRASTFTSSATAEDVISKTINSNRASINNWLKNSSKPDFELDYSGTRSIGRVADTSGVMNSTDARIVLQRSSNGKSYYIKTAYPTKPKSTAP